MKILIFSPYYPPHIGGLESHADQFNKYISKRGVSVTVFTPRLPKTSLEIETKYKRVKIIRFPAFEIIPNYPLPKFWMRKYWQLKQQIKKEDFDIIISRTRFFITSLQAFLYAKTKKTKWVHIEHGSDFVKSGGKIATIIAKIYDYTLGKLVLKNADSIVANSQASAKFCNKLGKNIECKVIYRGLETEKIISAPANKKLKEEYQNRVIITFLGRLYDGKGIADLIETLSRIKNKNFVCFIIGDGPERRKLETLAVKLGVKSRTVFFGYKQFEEYIKILKITDIFVNPSYTEGLPTTVAEAALCKNAIIATDVGGTNEIITNEKSGYLIEPKNIPALEAKLEVLMDNESLRRIMGSNAYQEVINKFSWSSSVGKYLTLFRQLSD